MFMIEVTCNFPASIVRLQLNAEPTNTSQQTRNDTISNISVCNYVCVDVPVCVSVSLVWCASMRVSQSGMMCQYACQSVWYDVPVCVSVSLVWCASMRVRQSGMMCQYACQSGKSGMMRVIPLRYSVLRKPSACLRTWSTCLHSRWEYAMTSLFPPPCSDWSGGWGAGIVIRQ